MGIFENGQNLLGNLKSSAIAETARKLAPFVIAGTVGYSAADLTVLAFRPTMLPSEAPPLQSTSANRKPIASLNSYDGIRNRNIFNSDGVIPDALSSDDKGQEVNTDEAVLSQLPLTLRGTIVHFNPARSIATIRLNSKNATKSFIPGEEIEGMAEVTSVTRRKVFITNLNNGRPEYIEIAEKEVYDFAIKDGDTAPKSDGPIAEKGRNNFSVKRSELERLTGNLSQILQQARMEPRFGPDNTVNGFCFVSIQGGTVFETLGFRVSDCISGVNGEPVDSPQKAMELFQKLRSENNIQLEVDRDGRSETFNYDIN